MLDKHIVVFLYYCSLEIGMLFSDQNGKVFNDYIQFQ